MTESAASAEALSFRALDGVALAVRHNRLHRYAGKTYHFGDIGPWLELRHLRDAGHTLDGGPQFVVSSLESPLSQALDNKEWINASPQVGAFVLRPKRTVLEQALLTPLGLDAQKCASICGIPKETILRITSALGEMFDNVFEHSEAPATGIAAFRAKQNTFEFVVADEGIGVLGSLQRSPTFAALTDHSSALEQAIRPNVSRFSTQPDRGHGFDRLVTGIANLNAELRFRSGDSVLQLSGVGQSVPRPTIARSLMVRGFVVSAKFFAQRPS